MVVLSIRPLHIILKYSSTFQQSEKQESFTQKLKSNKLQNEHRVLILKLYGKKEILKQEKRNK